MITRKSLEEMSEMDIRKMDKSTLVDIRNVEVDATMPIAERMSKYLHDIGNPYCFLVGDVPVQVSFNDKGKTLDETFSGYLKSNPY